jgi:hypothetical protein
VARSPQHEKLPKLRQSIAQPLPVAIGQADHRRGHRDQLVRLEVDELRCLGLADACRDEEERRGDPEYRGETCEHGCARLLNATRFELRDRRTRDADTARELGLCEVQTFACGPDREREGRPCCGFRDDRTLAR